MRKISVAILSWNGRHHLETCLPAVLEQEVPGFEVEVLVLDNGSSDGTSDWVHRHHPAIRLITSPVNLGFCAGNNRLVRAAGGEAVVLLNNDTLPQPGWLAALAEALETSSGDVAAVSGQIVDWTGDRLDFARGVMTFDGHAFQQDFGRRLSEVELPAAGSELLFACGGNMIVRRRSYLDAGGFDEDFFAYLEDVDLGWRLWTRGERVLFAPDALVRHRSMATSELLGTYNRGMLFERNALLTMSKNLDRELRGELMPAVLLTLIHRTQTLLVQNNPGGAELTVDPYAGGIANTAAPEKPPPISEPPPAPPVVSTTLGEKWRGYGPREFVRRALRKGARTVLPRWLLEDPQSAPRLTDPRTVAQLRAVTRMLAALDRSSELRDRIEAQRRRPDREIFERFPPLIVPTYPGDETWFASPAFKSWLPESLSFVRCALEDVMDLED